MTTDEIPTHSPLGKRTTAAHLPTRNTHRRSTAGNTHRSTAGVKTTTNATTTKTTNGGIAVEVAAAVEAGDGTVVIDESTSSARRAVESTHSSELEAVL
jgi:hypothetical protein